MRTAPSLINTAKPLIIAGDIGGTQTRWGIRSPEGTFDEIASYKTPDTYVAAIQQAAANIGSLVGRRQVNAIGFGVAGEVQDGRIVNAGNLKRFGWVDEKPALDLAYELYLEPSAIIMDNDVATATHAQRTARAGAQKQAEGIYVLSTGFGGARFTPDGRILPDEPGHRYLRAGHVCGCGEEGHLDAFVGGAGIARRFGQPAETIPHDDTRWTNIQNDFAEGMGLCLADYEQDGHPPSHLAFYGSIALNVPSILPSLQRSLVEKFGPDRAPIVDRAHYGNNSGLHGAHFMAQQHLFGA